LKTPPPPPTTTITGKHLALISAGILLHFQGCYRDVSQILQENLGIYFVFSSLHSLAVLVPPDHVRPLLPIGSQASPDPTLFPIGPPKFSALAD
jgi:hypothetical protein